MSELYERSLQDSIQHLAEGAGVPQELMEGPTSAEVFGAVTARPRERAQAAREWAADAAEAVAEAMEWDL